MRIRRRRGASLWAWALGLLVLQEGAGFLQPPAIIGRHRRRPSALPSSWEAVDDSSRRISMPLLVVASASTSAGGSGSGSNLIEPAAEREPPSPPAPPPSPPSTSKKAAAGAGSRKRKRPPPAAPPVKVPSAASSSSSSPPQSRPRPAPPQPRFTPSPAEQRLMDQLEGLRRRRRRDEFRALLRNRNQGLDVNCLKETGSIPLLEMLVRAAASCQEVEVAWDVLRSLLDREEAAEIAWVPQWDTFSTLMSACRRRRELDLLLRCFKAALPFQGFSKTVLLNILLAGLCDNGHMDVAAFYLETAEAKWEVMPNEVSWNTLLGAAVRAGRGRLVGDLEKKMAAQGVEGDVTTRNIRLQHLLASKPAAGLDLFERMKEEQEKFRRRGGDCGWGEEAAVMDLRTMNIMAGHLAKTRGYDEAQAMVEEVAARGLGIAPRAVTHNIMLDALLKAGRVDEALEYFYGVAGKAAAEAEKEEESRRRKSRKENETPLVDSTTYDILLSGLVQNGRVSTAVVVHSMMCKAGLSPTIYTYAALVRVQKTATDVYKIWSQARASCPRLSLPFLNILVYELGQVHNDLDGALYAFRAILRMGRRPNTISYNSLLSALMKDANATLSAPPVPGQAQPPSASAKRGGGGGGGGGPSARAIKKDGGEMRQDDGAYYPTSSALAPEAQTLLELLDSLQDRTLLEAALALLRSMYEGGTGAGSARPNARTFTILMAGISKADLGARGTALCVALYREAEAQGVRPNGILCHALLRAFGTDAAGALGFFKKEVRVRLKSLDQVNPDEEEEEDDAEGGELEEEEEDVRVIDGVITAGGNLSLAYMALLYICGVSGRADLALQLLYAMQRDGLPSDRHAWNAFDSGKTVAAASSTFSQLFMGPYESLLRAETMGGLGWETSLNKIRIKL